MKDSCETFSPWARTVRFPFFIPQKMLEGRRRGDDWICVLGSPRGIGFLSECEERICVKFVASVSKEKKLHGDLFPVTFIRELPQEVSKWVEDAAIILIVTENTTIVAMATGMSAPNAIDLPQQTAENKEVIYEDMKISSEIRSNEPKIPSVTDVDFVQSNADEIENTSAPNTQTITTIDGNSSTVREICYGFDQQRSETSLSIRSELYNVRKPYSSRVQETNADPLWGSCFELHLDFDRFQNQNTDRSKNTATSLEILHNKESSDLNITHISNMSGQKFVSASNEHFCIGINLYRI
uniref:Uncharacterized protein n=1 Tax=Onchocerca volvulus TaxID=6282 RepID=A0A8R1TK40_ONCVO